MACQRCFTGAGLGPAEYSCAEVAAAVHWPSRAVAYARRLSRSQANSSDAARVIGRS